MKKYVLAIDQGTTGTTCLLYDLNSKTILVSANCEFTQHFPRPGLVEHDLNEIWASLKQSFNLLKSNYSFHLNEIKAIGITNQRETICAFDHTGSPLYNAIVWQDRRTQNFCNDNQSKFTKFTKITGLPLDAYFSSTKIKWMMDNVSQIQNNIANTLFGTIDTYLLYKLTNGKSYKTDFTNASRTNLMDLKTGQWSDELKTFFGLENIQLPEICDSFHPFGVTQNCDFLPDGLPVLCILGDQQSALFGQGCINKGELKCTYGTGAFLLLNTGSEIKYSSHGLLSTAAFSHQGQKTYALEGSSYIAGAAVQWMRDNLRLFENANEIEKLAKLANNQDMQDLLFMPFFTGIGSPHWQSNAKACIYGMSRDTGIPQLSRACLEGIALSINDLVEAFAADMGEKLTEIKVDGGACKNAFLMQMQANFSNCKVIRPKMIESTALGVALGATMILNNIPLNEITQHYLVDSIYQPVSSIYEEVKTAQWKKFVKKVYLA